ncbi:MAG: tRNA (guanosine(46)-N7)-methyltransferase TrmB [Planctomycetia bacterium]
MPRRPPKKPDASVDLSSHFFTLERLPEPFQPRSLFPADLPVELEVGSGKGLFLSSSAGSRPDTNFLGIEIAFGYARLCAGKLAVAAATNARIIHGDAQRLVRAMLPDKSLSAVHVYFPDPWWKARHRKRRVLSEPFLQHAGRVLAPGGRLHVWTDVEEYFLEAMEAARATGVFSDPCTEPARPATHDLDYRTHFERRTRMAGQPVWRAALERTERPAAVQRVAAS